MKRLLLILLLIGCTSVPQPTGAAWKFIAINGSTLAYVIEDDKAFSKSCYDIRIAAVNEEVDCVAYCDDEDKKNDYDRAICAAEWCTKKDSIVTWRTVEPICSKVIPSYNIHTWIVTEKEHPRSRVCTVAGIKCKPQVSDDGEY